MPITDAARVMAHAEQEGYAIGMFDTSGGNLDLALAILSAAERWQAPVMISAGYEEMEAYCGAQAFAALVRGLAAHSPASVILHLDHCTDVEQVEACIGYGFTSVMFDGSRLSPEENVAGCQRVVALARPHGVWVEGELGVVGGFEGDRWAQTDTSIYTDPGAAQEFVRVTGIDAFAPAVGTAHGFYREEPQLDFARLAEIDRLVPVPLALHGASGVSMADLRRAVRCGIRKVNVATALRAAFRGGMEAYLAGHQEEYLALRYLKAGRAAVVEVIGEHLEAFGCVGRGAQGRA